MSVWVLKSDDGVYQSAAARCPAGDESMSIIMLVFIGLCFMFAAIVKLDGLMFTDALILLCSAFVLAKEEKRRG
ncbi:hypothetical protein [Cronobacter sakazakii]|uniref:hypothetical protein n=1 Tax=Cronobacter sakazakii TaxID=28141 RepID=UPI001055721A|nr:hypothetical protein [Cronobacter sakazakii]